MVANVNSLRNLQSLGQSIWVEVGDQETDCTDQLRQLIDQEGVSGMLFPPLPVNEQRPVNPAQTAARTATQDQLLMRITDAADLLGRIHQQSQASEGFVCVGIPEQDMHDSARSIEAARQLWQTLDRPNLMININATSTGTEVLQQLICDGINVSVTLTDEIDGYWDIADAYCAGLEARVNAGLPIDRIASVIHLPLARIDERIDPILTRITRHTRLGANQLAGKAAIACAKRIYQDYRQSMMRQRFQLLRRHNAQPQRPLWAASNQHGAKQRQDLIRYIQPLIGPLTVSALSLGTISAYQESSVPLTFQATVNEGMAEAGWVLTCLRGMGIDF